MPSWFLYVMAGVLVVHGYWLSLTWRKIRQLEGERVYWYARTAHAHRMGIFRTQLEAWESVIELDGEPAQGATVWCEHVSSNRGLAKAQKRSST